MMDGITLVAHLKFVIEDFKLRLNLANGSGITRLDEEEILNHVLNFFTDLLYLRNVAHALLPPFLMFFCAFPADGRGHVPGRWSLRRDVNQR